MRLPKIEFSDPFKEALKEWARVFLITFISSELTFLTGIISAGGGKITFLHIWSGMASALLAAVSATIKSIDKFMHLNYKELDVDKKGFLPF